MVNPNQDLAEAAEYLVLASYILTEYFPQMTSKINAAPKDIAVAITGGYVLEGRVFGQTDFFGPAINVAAKVCSNVRPAGCFIHESLPLQLIPKELANQLEQFNVMVKSQDDKWEERGLKYTPTRYRKKPGIEPIKVTPYKLDESEIRIQLDGSNSCTIPHFHITADQVQDPSQNWFAFIIWVRQGGAPATTPILIPWRKAKSIVVAPTIGNVVGTLDIGRLLKVVRERASGWIEEIEILHPRPDTLAR